MPPNDYDLDNPVSPDGGALSHTKTLLSEQSAFWELSGKPNASQALSHIVSGVGDSADDDVRFQVEELADQGMIAQLFAPIDSQAASEHDAGLTNPLVGGSFMLCLRRQCPESEVFDTPAKRKTQLWFYDYVSLLRQQLEIGGVNCPRIRRINVIEDAAYGSFEEEVAQGTYLFATLQILWGDALS